MHVPEITNLTWTRLRKMVTAAEYAAAQNGLRIKNATYGRDNFAARHGDKHCALFVELEIPRGKFMPSSTDIHAIADCFESTTHKVTYCVVTYRDISDIDTVKLTLSPLK